METLKVRLEKFTEMHEQFHEDWNYAMKTGDTSAVEKMADDYYVTFFQGPKAKPMFFDRNEALEGMKQSVQELQGSKKKFENKVIRMKDEETASVFYEQIIEKDDQVIARLFTIENWQCNEGKWLITREVEEQIQ